MHGKDCTPPKSVVRRIEYIPPSDEVIRHYAHTVCREFSRDSISTAHFTGVFQGFTEFVTLLVRVQTKYLNGRQAHAEQNT